MGNPQRVYTEKMTSYMEEKSGKGQSHGVHVVGNRQHVFEVMLRDKGGIGIGRQKITMKCRLWLTDNKYECTCNKPSLMHLSCSHVLAYCAKGSVESEYFVSLYYRKEVVQSTWCHELLGWRAVKDFMKLLENGLYWIPDPNSKVNTKG